MIGVSFHGYHLLWPLPTQKMMEVYGQLAEAFSKIVTIMQTDRRYLATYYRVAFYGRVRGCGVWVHVWVWCGCMCRYGVGACVGVMCGCMCRCGMWVHV